MQFEWYLFTEDVYSKVVSMNEEDYVGAIRVGDISVDLIVHADINKLSFDFYVLHEETGYGKTKHGIPYDFADGFYMDINDVNLSYEDFKKVAEKKISDYITDFKGAYSLFEHANRPMEIWQ